MSTVTVVSDWIQYSLCCRRPTLPFTCGKGEEKEVLRGQKQTCGPSEMSNERDVFAYKASSFVTV